MSAHVNGALFQISSSRWENLAKNGKKIPLYESELFSWKSVKNLGWGGSKIIWCQNPLVLLGRQGEILSSWNFFKKGLINPFKPL